MTKELKTLIESLVKEAIVAPQSSQVTVLLDMDGVIADFDTGVSTGLPSINKAKETYQKLLAGFPEMAGLTDDDVKKRLAGPQADPGLKALKRAFNYYRDQKFIPAGKPGFFLNLPMMPGAKELVSAITSLTGKSPTILTAPVDSNASCEQEKRAWVEKNLPGMVSGFICTQEKEKYANANSILIDDRTKYTNKFIGAGGTAILFKSVPQAVQELRAILKSRGLPTGS